MKSLELPRNCDVADRLLATAFNLYDRDYLNCTDKDVSISQRVQLVIDQYELHKHELGIKKP